MLPLLAADENKKIAICVALSLLSVVVYFNALQGEFLNYDDNIYLDSIRNNDDGFLSLFGWSFSTVINSNWHPLTVLSLVVDYKIYGDNPAGFHLSNVLLHIVNALLVFLVFFKLSKNYLSSLFVASLFVVHPLNVESVAWIAERKGLLASLFFLGSVYCFQHFIETKRRDIYAYSLVLFVLSLLAKAVFVILPFILMLVELYRVKFNADLNAIKKTVLTQVPFFVIALLIGIVTIYTHSASGSISDGGQWSAVNRVINALAAYAFYIEKMFVPSGLAVSYLAKEVPVSVVVFYLVVLAFSLLFACRYREKQPVLLFGLLWFLVILLPVIGLIKSGSHAYADRYAYIPLLGLFFIAAHYLTSLFNKTGNRLFLVVLVIVPLGYAVAAVYEVPKWKNDYRLFKNILIVDKDNYIAHSNLASRYIMDGDIQNGIKHYYFARKANSGYRQIYDFVSNAFLVTGQEDLAVNVLKDALVLTAIKDKVLIKIAQVRINQEKYAEAIQALNESYAINDDPETLYLLGHAWFYSGDMQQAQHYLLRHESRYPKRFNTLLLLARSYKKQHDQAKLSLYRNRLLAFPDRQTEVLQYLD